MKLQEIKVQIEVTLLVGVASSAPQDIAECMRAQAEERHGSARLLSWRSTPKE